MRTSYNFTLFAGENLLALCHKQYADAGDLLSINNIIVTAVKHTAATSAIEFCLSTDVVDGGPYFERVVFGHGTPGTAGENVPLACINTLTGDVTLYDGVTSISGAVELVSSD